MPTFMIALRGYRIAEVDRWVEWAEQHPDQARTAEPPQFNQTLRGYARREVDEWISGLRTPR
ncbi:hypothetical protein [Cryptosporangium arvum]|nr:hypothetical protein [Cryptosporangium arvum]